MRKGDIVLLPFPFTDLSGSKTRPALALVDMKHDIIVAFITTQTRYKEEFDLSIEPDSQNRLKFLSVIKFSKLTTIDKQLVLGKLVTVNLTMISEIDSTLSALFHLG